MKSTTKKWLAGILAGMMVLSLAACGPKETLVSSGSPVTYPEDGIYPVSCEDVLTTWGPMQAVLSTKVSNFADTEYAKGLVERTGITVEYIHPAAGNIEEQLNLLLASGELPDVLANDWTKYGAEAAIANEYIINLNDVLDQWAPNLKATLKERPEYDKLVKTDEGNYYVFPSFRDSAIDCIYQGPIVRKDWLDSLGMEVPETIEEWDAALRAFKNELGVAIPLSAHYKELAIMFAGAYGVQDTFYLDKGKIVYGPATEGYKEYLTQMNKWYTEGLLDKNVATFDWSVLATNVLNGNVGLTFGAAASGIGNWTIAKADDPTYELIGAKYPVMKKGDKPEFAAVASPFLANGSAAITGQCKNVELAARWLDYGYSEEGRMYNNFGTEGVSYNMVDGEPVFSDMIMNDPAGISPAMMMYAKGTYSGTFIQDGRVVAQMQSKPAASRAAVLTWAENNMEEHLMPLTTPTIEEQAEVSNLRSELDTYVDEMTLKFIVGQESLDGFDTFVSKIESFGLERLFELYNAGLKRYNAR
ncbi:MAG: extracellular solute-binding protein [Ruminococcaceae bacterium]|nr:extracellular solute-binding protein [Oscillospiraceae bacterium]